VSYDVYFEIDTGAGERTEIDWKNYTSNVGAMWARALKNEGEHPGEIWKQFDYGLAHVIDEHPKASDLGPIVRAAVDRMRDAGQAAYADLEPGNGWGDYPGALAYLTWIADTCEKHPSALVRVWI
jgi:hypothetical protein